jgi:sulfur carrier protein
MPLYDGRMVKSRFSIFYLKRTRILMPSSCHMEAFSLVINGESRSFPAPMTLASLVEALGYSGKRVAIERNGEIVPRSQHGEVALVNGDKLEIVVAVGGG